MIDQTIIDLFKTRIKNGFESVETEDIGKMFTLISQIAEEDEEIQEILEDTDISVQAVISDIDKYFYLIAKEGKLETGEGKIDNPSFTFSTTLEVGFGLLIGEIDGTSAYMSGDFKVEGSLADAMEFLEIIEISMENLDDLLE